MKGLKKCYGLLLALFIMGGLSLNVSLENTKALRHDVTALPLYSDTIYTPSLTGRNLQNVPISFTWVNSEYSQINDLNVNVPWKFGSWFDGSLCNYSSGFYDKTSFISGNTIYLGGSTSGFVTYRGVSDAVLSAYPSQSSQINCNQTSPFGSLVYPFFGSSNISHPSFFNDSIPSGIWLTKPDPSSLLPYNYSYSHAFVTRTHISTDNDGYHYDTSLKASDLLGVVPNKFSNLSFPFGRADQYNVGNLTEGRSIEYRGIFSFPNTSLGNGFSYSPAFGQPGSYFRLVFTGIEEFSLDYHQVSYTQTVDCNLRSVNVGNDFTIQYSCPLELDQDYLLGYASLEIGFDSSFSGSLSDEYIFDTNADWIWSGIRVITDNDETLANPYNDTPSGNDLESAPNGSTSVPSDEQWYDNLSGLFNFSLINPFQNIWALFTDSNSCVNIPIIAGMIHSEETHICPWFDSGTRAILTPVIGLSSMMLLFGFVIHWLGARSGNLFEDEVSTDNYSFKNKFRRRK